MLYCIVYFGNAWGLAILLKKKFHWSSYKQRYWSNCQNQTFITIGLMLHFLRWNNFVVVVAVAVVVVVVVVVVYHTQTCWLSQCCYLQRLRIHQNITHRSTTVGEPRMYQLKINNFPFNSSLLCLIEKNIFNKELKRQKFKI